MKDTDMWEVAKKQQRGQLRLVDNLNFWFTHDLGSNVQVLPLTTNSKLKNYRHAMIQYITPNLG